MFFLNFRKSGWLKRYLLCRLSEPFEAQEIYAKLDNNSVGPDELEKALYSVVRSNGILFGCPIISDQLLSLANKHHFPKQRGGTILLYLETLFSVTLNERALKLKQEHYKPSSDYEEDLKQVVLLILRYYLPDSYFRLPDDVSLSVLLKHNESINGAFKKLEMKLLDSITLQGYSSTGNRQNLFAFSELFFFLLWSRDEIDGKNINPKSHIEIEAQLREEMILAFAALIWADDYIADIERQVIEKYIEQTGLSDAKQNQLLKRIDEPIHVAHLKLSFVSEIIRSYLLEQLILLSLINNQEAWQEKELIEQIAHQLCLPDDELEALYCYVAEFFSIHGNRLDFLRNNAAVQQFQDYMNDKVVFQVKKNLGKILVEIEETKELSELLLKATTQPLTAVEKQKVQDQLMDIMKTIPALAIFALPGGGLLLPILIKFLPFNILPSAFNTESDPQ